jgi:hypothetical protein
MRRSHIPTPYTRKKEHLVPFPSWARLGLGVIVGVLGYLVVGELHASEQVTGGIAALVVLLGSAGIVPPTAETLPALSPQARLALTAGVTVLAYVLEVVVTLDETVTAVLIAVLAFCASIGIVPPQAGQPVP